MTEQTPVTCASCGTGHTEGQDIYGPGAAAGCSAAAAHDGIRTYHGSVHDGDDFAWIARPDWAVDGQICDACIAAAFAAGAIANTTTYDEQLGCHVRTLLADDEAAQAAVEAEQEALYSPDDAPVVCATCQTAHTSVMSHRNRQANGCAAEADDRGVTGHYGSSVCDLEHWAWRQRPNWVRDGVICDTCLTALKDIGAFHDPVRTEAFGSLTPAEIDALLGEADAGEPGW